MSKIKFNLFNRRFSPHRTEHAEYFDSQSMLTHFERVFSSEIFDIGSRPIFSYNMAPGKELRDSLSSFLRDLQDRRRVFNNLHLAKECKVEVQVGEKVKVFIKILNAIDDQEMVSFLNIKKELETANGLKMVISRHNNRIGLIGSKPQEASIVGKKEEVVMQLDKGEGGLNV